MGAFACTALLRVADAAALAPADPVIVHAEPVRVLQKAATGSAQTIEFDGFGRRYQLLVYPNERLADVLRVGGAEPLRGTIVGAQSSWVRLTRLPNGAWTGLVVDGGDAFAIEPSRDVAPYSTTALSKTSVAPVAYRLADVLLPDGLGLCATGDAETAAAQSSASVTADASVPTALDALGNVTNEIQAAAALTATKQLNLGLVGDLELSQYYAGRGENVDDAMVARMNVVDGIFSTQLAVHLQVANLTVFRSAPDAFAATDASTMLTQLRDWRATNISQLQNGLTHLMTGVDMTGDTVGIAYIGTLCGGRSASGLSEGWRSLTSAALIAAHEIGHNFGAVHDGDAANACASTPQTFLMAPRISGSDTFSQCSLDTMAPFVAAAACLTTLPTADAALSAPSTTVRATAGVAFDFAFSVDSVGDGAVNAVGVTLTLPAEITAVSAATVGGSCTVGAGTVSCSLGTLAPGESRNITVRLQANSTGSLAARLALSATNDRVASNDTRDVAFDVAASVDLAATLVVAPASLDTGATTIATATVRNTATSGATGVALTFSVPAGLTVASIDANSLGCSLSAGAISCASGQSLAAGASTTVSATLTAATAGTHAVAISVAGGQTDPDTANNAAQVSVTVTSPPTGGGGSGGGTGGGTGGTGGSTGASSGGGGAFDLASGGVLLVLSALAALSRRRISLIDLRTDRG